MFYFYVRFYILFFIKRICIATGHDFYCMQETRAVEKQPPNIFSFMNFHFMYILYIESSIVSLNVNELISVLHYFFHILYIFYYTSDNAMTSGNSLQWFPWWISVQNRLGIAASTDYADNGHRTWEKFDHDDESLNRRKWKWPKRNCTSDMHQWAVRSRFGTY